jgi:hypothetical protein
MAYDLTVTTLAVATDDETPGLQKLRDQQQAIITKLDEMVVLINALDVRVSALE